MVCDFHHETESMHTVAIWCVCLKSIDYMVEQRDAPPPHPTQILNLLKKGNFFQLVFFSEEHLHCLLEQKLPPGLAA